jgi:ribose-phosphate pyrophosphokinase
MHEVWSIFAGTANPALAEAIAGELGIRLAQCSIARFPDGELSVELNESVRGQEVIIIQPTCPPVDEHVMELLALADACRRAAARRITTLVPYFGYARSDRRQGHRVPVTASMVASLMQCVGIDQVVTLDMHAPQIEGFFYVPVDSLSAVPVLAAALGDTVPEGAVVVSPDTGRVGMATEYAQRLGTSVVVLHKRRESGTSTAVTHVVGDVRGRPCVIVDDMISTGGTIARSIEALLAAGARPEIIVVATHGLLVDHARALLQHESVRAVFVTDTVPVATSDWPALHVVSVAPLLARVIRQFTKDGSLRGLG